MDFRTSPVQKLSGTIKIPGDKSISHRALIFSSLSVGKSYLHGLLESEDCLNTLKSFRAMGVDIKQQGKGFYLVEGVGLTGLKEPETVLDCGNSGTTMRLLSGLLAAQDFYSVLTGDDSLRQRPMDRITIPLKKMGAKIWSRQGKYAPLSIQGGQLEGLCYKLPVASAQLKSAILLAGIASQVDIEIIEPAISRDHTERMLHGFGIELAVNNNKIVLNSSSPFELSAQEIMIPGDISSAAFFIAAALLIPESELILKNVGINPSRTGFLEIIKQMGAQLEFSNIRETGGEPVADIKVNSSELKSVNIEGDIIPTLIDELPLLAILSARADGDTIIRDAEELRVKESDRIKVTVDGLRLLGVDVEELSDGMIIHGYNDFKGQVEINSYYDHRIAMSFAIAGLAASSPFVIKNSEAINTSFPEFTTLLDSVIS